MINSQTQLFIKQHINDDIRTLALRKSPPEVDLTMALQQIAARQTLIRKLPEWVQMPHTLFPAHLELEQASSELTAKYKASLVSGSSMTDLTGGMGVDCYYLAKQFKEAHYVEQQLSLCQLAQHNFDLMAPHISVHINSAEAYLKQMQDSDLRYIAPARRDNIGRKTVTIADCTPDLTALLTSMLEKAPRILVKLSPMLDIALALRQLNYVAAIHIIATDNECKELLFDIRRNFQGEPELICTNLRRNGTHQITPPQTRIDEQHAQISLTSALGLYLFEPNAAILKAGFFKSTAQRYNLQKLHISSHLYTGNVEIPAFEGRRFRILQTIPFSKKEIKTHLAKLQCANIATRNFPISAPELRKQLKLKEGGNEYIFATTLANNARVLILCHKTEEHNNL